MKNNYRVIAYEIYKMKRICSKCKSTKNINVHHKDENRLNNDRNNLQILCSKCHSIHHFKGKKRTDEVRKNMSKAQLGNTNLLGHKHTEKTKDKMSKAHLGNKNLLGYKHTDQAKKKISESCKSYWKKRKSII